MSNNTNNIQSQSPSAVYERLYGVYRNVAQLDAPMQLNQLPEGIRNQLYGQVYQLANRPVTNDPEWGRNNAFRDLHRLQAAIQQLAYNIFRNLPTEQRNPVAERIWIYGGRQQGDPNWGENHANDNVDILFRGLIEGMSGRPIERPVVTILPVEHSLPMNEEHLYFVWTTEGFREATPSENARAFAEFFHAPVRSNPSTPTTQTTSHRAPPILSVSSSSRNNVTPSSQNPASSGSVTADALRARMARMGLGDRLDAENNQPSSVINPVSTGSASGSDDLSSRKSASIARIDQINNMGDNRINRFDLAAAISTFNLDVLLQDYAENHDPRRLLELVSWAGIGDDKRDGLTEAIQRYEHDNGQQERLVCSLFSKLFSYFDQKKNRPEVSQDNLKVQFRGVVDKIIDANRNCVDQMLSQLQDMMLDIAVEAYIPTEGDRRLGKILCRAGHELCVYKTNLIKQICVRQNPSENHMADLERLVMLRLSAVLGLQGAIFNSGARYGHLLCDVDNKVNRAVDTFWQDYRPLEYLSNQLSIIDTNMSKLRNELNEWADNHYGIAAEDTDHPQTTDMNPRLSADFDPDTFKDFLNGGVWTPAGTFFLLEAAGFIRQV